MQTIVRPKIELKDSSHCSALNDDTKILTETNTETFLLIPNFPKLKLFFSMPNFLKPKLFSRDQILRNPPEIGKSLETETKTKTSQYL